MTPTGSRKKLDCEQQSGFFLFGQSLSGAQAMDGRKKPGSRAADSSFMLGLAPQSGFAKHSLKDHDTRANAYWSVEHDHMSIFGRTPPVFFVTICQT